MMKRELAALLLAGSLLPGCQQRISPEGAVADLKARVTADNLYPWTTIDRLDFGAWRTTDQYVEVQVSEIHRGDDGADPNTSPTVAFFRLNRRSGQWEVEWPAPGEGWISYDAYLTIQRERSTSSEEGPRIPNPKGHEFAVVRTFAFHLPPGAEDDDGGTTISYGHVWIHGDATNVVGVQWAWESRGEQFDLNPFHASGGSLVPDNLQWDSTGRYLYYEFGGGPSASGVWRVDPTSGVPRYVSSTREHFRLLPQEAGPDVVVCSQVRDGQWLWYAYTPGDIEAKEHAFSTNQVQVATAVAP